MDRTRHSVLSNVLVTVIVCAEEKQRCKPDEETWTVRGLSITEYG